MFVVSVVQKAFNLNQNFIDSGNHNLAESRAASGPAVHTLQSAPTSGGMNFKNQICHRFSNSTQLWLNYVTRETFCYWQEVQGNQSWAPNGDKRGEGQRGWSGQRQSASLLQKPRDFCQLC